MEPKHLSLRFRQRIDERLDRGPGVRENGGAGSGAPRLGFVRFVRMPFPARSRSSDSGYVSEDDVRRQRRQPAVHFEQFGVVHRSAGIG